MKSLYEAIKSERDISNVKKAEVKVPALEKKDRIANIKWNRETKFKKMKEDYFFFLEPDEGFFFSYNPSENYYLESNASFSFIVNEGPRRDHRRSWIRAPYSFERITHPGVGYTTSPKFRVMKRTKKIFLEKIFGGNTGSKLKAQTMRDPLEYTDALKIAIKEHPELENYKFVPLKMKVKEFIEKGPESLESGGEQFVFAPVTGEKAKEIIEKEEYTGNVYFDKKVAKEQLKNLTSKDIYGVKAVVQMKAKGSTGFKEKEFGNYKFDGKIEPKSAKVVTTNYSEFFDKDFVPAKEVDKSRYEDLMGKGPHGKLVYWEKMIIAKDEKEWNYFTIERRAEEKGRRSRRTQTIKTWSDMPFGSEVHLKNGIKVMVFKPGTTQEQIDKFMGYLWFKETSAHAILRWDNPLRKTAGYEIVFQNKFPDELKYIIINQAFKDSEWDRRAAVQMVNKPIVK